MCLYEERTGRMMTTLDIPNFLLTHHFRGVVPFSTSVVDLFNDSN